MSFKAGDSFSHRRRLETAREPIEDALVVIGRSTAALTFTACHKGLSDDGALALLCQQWRLGRRGEARHDTFSVSRASLRPAALL